MKGNKNLLLGSSLLLLLQEGLQGAVLPGKGGQAAGQLCFLLSGFAEPGLLRLQLSSGLALHRLTDLLESLLVFRWAGDIFRLLSLLSCCYLDQALCPNKALLCLRWVPS